MGKAQSKRSIDITTDPKKVGEGNEVAGKVEKIEDLDQGAAAPPAANGDAATPQDKTEDAAAAGEVSAHTETPKSLGNNHSFSFAISLEKGHWREFRKRQRSNNWEERRGNWSCS